MIAPAVEQDLRRAVGLVVAVAIGHEQQIRRGADPHAAEAEFDSAHEVQPLQKHLGLFEPAVAVGILENQDAVFALTLGRANRIGISLGHPQPAAIVHGHRDRLHHVRLAGQQRDFETFGHDHLACRFLGRQARERIFIGLGRAAALGNDGLVACSLKSSKLICPQPPPLASTRRMKICWPAKGRKSTTTGLSVSVLSPERSKITRLLSRLHQFHARFVSRSAGDAKAGVRLCHFERGGSERPLRSVAIGNFEAADPELSDVVAGHAAAAGRDRIALDRLPGKGLAAGHPIVERALFEIQIERPSVHAARQFARGAGGPGRYWLRRLRGNGRHKRQRQQKSKLGRCAHFVSSEIS